MKYSGTEFDRFFQPLVGDQARVDELRADLTRSVALPQGESFKPYDGLSLGYRFAAERVQRDLVTEAGDDDNERAKWVRIGTNGIVAGSLTVFALRGLGEIYASPNTKPQYMENVQTNVSRVVRHIYGMAFRSDEQTLARNWQALRFGLDPNSSLALPLSYIANKMKSEQSAPSRRSFIVSEIEGQDEQLDIQVRYKKREVGGGHQCPAVHAMIEGVDHKIPALVLLMKTLGEVVVSEIYPRQFTIVRGESVVGHEVDSAAA
ncbi:MAG TPA: hypothetical protein VLG47_05765 [Candidatus Saccharimonadales bacterium]|nr:hypothetical protein [Candidatus Saccharimonadales bacterium]